MKVSDLIGLDRVLGNIGHDLGPDEADRAISDLFGEIRSELGCVDDSEHSYYGCRDGRGNIIDGRTDTDTVWGY